MLKKVLLISIIATQLCAFCVIADHAQLSGDAVQSSSMTIEADSVERAIPTSSSTAPLPAETMPVTPSSNTLAFRLQKMCISIFVDLVFKYYGH